MAPTRSQTRLRFVPLTPALLEHDFEAVMHDMGYLRAWSGQDWPTPHFTAADNLVDLQRHDEEHRQGIAWTYSVLAAEEDGSGSGDRVIGCIYAMPLHMALATREVHVPPALTGAAEELTVRGWAHRNACGARQLIEEALALVRREHWPDGRVWWQVPAATFEDQLQACSELGLGEEVRVKGATAVWALRSVPQPPLRGSADARTSKGAFGRAFWPVVVVAVAAIAGVVLRGGRHGAAGELGSDGGGSGPSFPCMLRKCWRPLVRCGLSPQCGNLVSCLNPCADDTLCQMHCLLKLPDDEAFSALMACTAVNGCNPPQPPPPSPPPPPPSAFAPFDLPAFARLGTLHLLAAYNKEIECYPCQTCHVRSHPFDAASAEYEHVYHFAGDGERCGVTKSIRVKLRQGERPGVIEASYAMFGTCGADKWYLIHVDNSDGKNGGSLSGGSAMASTDGLVVIYYTTKNASPTVVRGVLVWSRHGPGPLSPQQRDIVSSTLARANVGISLDDLCLLEGTNEECARAPSLADDALPTW